jgi:hypothetical protein
MIVGRGLFPNWKEAARYESLCQGRTSDGMMRHAAEDTL